MWSGLLGALKADGLIAKCIETSSENTTRYLTMLALDNINKDGQLTWIPVAIGPNPKCEVFAINVNNLAWPGELLHYDKEHGMWLTRNGMIMTGITHYMVIPPRSSAKDLI